MTRGLELATTLGTAALAGIGIAPFLHRVAAPDTWFSVQWPREVDQEDVESLLRHLASLRRPEAVAFELRAYQQTIAHFIGFAAHDIERVRHLFATFIPGALLAPIERRVPRIRHSVELRLGSRERALRTDASNEVTRSVLGALHGAGGTVVVQWLLGPRLAPMHVSKDSVGLPSTGRAIGQAFRYGLAPLEGRARAELQSKVGDHGFRARLMIGSSISERKVAHGVLRRVVGGLQVAEAPGVLWKVRSADAGTVISARPPRRWNLAVNVAELVGLLGWPLADHDYPGVKRIASRRLPVPTAIPTRDRVIGDGNHPQSARPVAVHIRDALLHTHVIGPTGVGKSTLLANLITQDMAAGRGVVVIEPKGDLVADVLARVPEGRERDVVLLDATDTVAPVGLNPLTGASSSELVADQLMAVLRGLYGDLLGPRTTDVLHASLLTLARSNQATLVALPLLLTDARLRTRLTEPVRDDLALGSFWRWYDALSEAERQQVIAPSLNKIRRFIHAPIRTVVGQLAPRFDVSQVFTERKIMLVPLSKGTLGSETASLVGSLAVAQLWQAAQARATVAPERRHPVSVYIDEFQDFLHLPTDLADVLTTARSYGIAAHLAHQHLGQLTPTLRAAVLANARNRLCFRLSVDDANALAKTTKPLDTNDFQSLGRYDIYASLVAEGEGQPYCSATTRPLTPTSSDPERIRAMSREQYGRNLAEVEAELRNLVGPPSGAVVGKRERGKS